jgi:N-hydroxyarylamine O-acetyltransferase
LPPVMTSTPRPEGRSAELLSAYLERLGIDEEPPSVEALFRIFRAHVERVPYETTWLHMGEQWDIDADSSMERVALRGRGGYCYHLNGSLSRLLALLGYEVAYHVGGVHGPEPSADDLTNHLVLVVSGLPSAENPGGDWYVDAGLGDALYEPLPLRAGTYHQDPNTFVLEETPGGIADWHFVHDPQGTFVGMNFRAPSTSLDVFQNRHQHLSTSPESGFVRTVTVQRRHPDGLSALRALTFTARNSTGTTTRLVTDRHEWFALIADEFLLDLDNADESARDRLWASACASHAAREVHD